MQLAQLLACAWALAPCAQAFSNLPDDHFLWGAGGRRKAEILKRATSTSTKAADSQCTNGPLSRNCWSSGYSIATDFDAKWPTTGQTQEYHLTITNSTCNPDGNSPGRTCYLINGQYPGPPITANWGDYFSVTVTNNMQYNATSMHWHGIRQLNTNIMDGVSGITECPLPPGTSEVYYFQATQFGTSWYHSHHSTQYGDGVLGPIVINGPAAANYDQDIGPILLTDWFYETVTQANIQWGNALQQGQPGPPGDTILINGLNVSPAGGSYFTQTITEGKKYLLRLINTSVDNAIRVTLDDHPFLVITSDFVPIKPFYTTWLLLAIGQRYDVIINANQSVGNYWMHAKAETNCASNNKNNASAIFRYSGAPVANPTTTPPASPAGCADADGSPLVPYVVNNVGSVSQFKQQASALNVNLNLPGTQTNQENIVTWGIKMTAIDAVWGTPTLTYVANGTTTYPVSENVIILPTEGIWTFWIIQEVAAGPAPLIPHPMHLHGHDFYVLGKGTGTFNISSDPNTLTYTNPPRRDTTFLPGGGWVVLAFPTDNPGAWLMHCHIAWHISEGLGVQFVEAATKINLPGPAYTSQCAAFNSYEINAPYPEEGSGL